MTRLRATLSKSAEDSAVASHLDRASREVERALELVRGARRTAGYRGRRVERDLRAVLVAIESVGSIASRYGAVDDDPDMISEDERNRQAREALDLETETPPAADYDEEGDG